MFVSAPAIGRLFACSRIAAWRRVREGHFGPVKRRGRAFLVDLRNVEARAGRKFSPAQLAAAGVDLPPELENWP